jgi:hypothetical protein
VVEDPPGDKIGCGGSTMHVLHLLDELYGPQLYQRTRTLSPLLPLRLCIYLSICCYLFVIYLSICYLLFVIRLFWLKCWFASGCSAGPDHPCGRLQQATPQPQRHGEDLRLRALFPWCVVWVVSCVVLRDA